ncbi:MAG: CsgG/HfaB family protein, partial [Synergistales bacterium]|nr:CsgG/HfaB family protein [Synergistales bacterium]
IAKEQQLAASGMVDPGTAVQVGRLAGAQWIITGAITEFTLTQSGGVIPVFGSMSGIAAGESKARVALDARVIDLESSQVRWTVREKGRADKSLGGIMLGGATFAQQEKGGLLSAATYDCIKKIVVALQSRLQAIGQVEAYHVIDVRGSKRVLIDAAAARSNVSEGQRFVVYAEGAPITGLNGEILGVEKYNLAVLEVVDVQSGYSTCEVVKGSAAEIKRGDLLAPTYDKLDDIKISSRTLAQIGAGDSGSSSLTGGTGTVSGSGTDTTTTTGSTGGAVATQQPAVQQQPAQPQQTQTVSAPSGGIADTSESMEIVDLYPIDQGVKNQIRTAHKAGYYNYSKRHYAKAYNGFVTAFNLYEGNYLDAYWAARAAYKRGYRSKMNEWLDTALSINPNYQPALDFKSRHGK